MPTRNALLADVVAPSAYGRAYSFERAMDNLGAIIGPLLGIALVALVGVRDAILLSIVPGLPRRRRDRLRDLRREAAVRHRAPAEPHPGATGAARRARAPHRRRRGLRARRRGRADRPGADTAYNVAAALVSVPAGRAGDRSGPRHVLLAGVAAFAAAYLLFAATGPGLALLAAGFVLAGVGIGCVETAQHAAVASLAPERLRGSAFGMLATVQSVGNLAASGIAGLLWTLVSPAAAFLYAAGWMLVALVAFGAIRGD